MEKSRRGGSERRIVRGGRTREGGSVTGTCGSGSRLRRGRDVDTPRRRVAATPRPPRGHSVEASRGDAAAATWAFRGDESRRRRGRDADSPWRRGAATPRGHSAEASRGRVALRSRDRLRYARRWLRVARAPAPDGAAGFARRGGRADDEAVALDVARPDAPKPGAPVVLVLHGLNGGSAEAYVQDLVAHVTARGGVACVLVARGLMATPVRDDLFHGARPGGTRRGAFENARGAARSRKVRGRVPRRRADVGRRGRGRRAPRELRGPDRAGGHLHGRHRGVKLHGARGQGLRAPGVRRAVGDDVFGSGARARGPPEQKAVAAHARLVPTPASETRL